MTCNKCRQAPPREGDTWCLACSAWESIGVSLGSKWVSAGLRGSAAEAVVGAARVLKSLRNIDAGLVARAKSEASRPQPVKEEKAEPEREKERSRSPLPRTRSIAPPVGEALKEEYSEGSESEEASEEDKREVDQAGAGSRGRQRPPEPAIPPRHHHRGEEDKRKELDREKDHHSDRRKKHKKKEDTNRRPKSSRRGHRGGRKHKRLGRLVDKLAGGCS